MNDLMQRRFKVIADYPNNSFKVGTVLSDTGWGGWLRYGDRMLNLSTVKDYPHLFKELQWWEERSLDEMPKYLKDEHGEVFKVIQYHNPITDHVLLKKNFIDSNFPYGGHSLFELLPATEEEYNSYIKTKQ